MALLQEGLEVARGPVGLDEIGSGDTEIEWLEPAKAGPPLRRGWALLVVSDQAQQIIPDAQPVQIGTTP
ncbi:MAG: hypothetical protein ACRDRU_27310 [Pseudonocardiaceae bacterium]